MSELLTPAARRLVHELEVEARFWNATATTSDDIGALMRARAEARRDQTDAVLQRLRRFLPDIEAEAVAVELAETLRLERELDGVA